MKTTLLLLFALFAGDARDHWVIRLENDKGPLATGFALDAGDGQAIIVTAQHVLAATATPIRINGRLVARDAVLGMDAECDVAAFLVPWSGEVGGLSSTLPTVGLGVRSEGWRTGTHSGRVVSVAEDNAYLSYGVDLGDSGSPVVSEQSWRIVGMIVATHEYDGQPGPPAFGPTVGAIKTCLRKWGWRCQGDRCVPINPPTATYPSATPITPQSPPVKWEPITQPTEPFEATANAELLARFDRLVDQFDRSATSYQLRIDTLERRIRELEARPVFESLDVSELPPIRFSIRGPQGIETKAVPLGGELRLYNESVNRKE